MPVPTIFLIDDQHKIVEMSDQPYDSEQLLQDLLAEFPSVLAGDQMGGSAPVKWLLVAREAGIPDEDGGAERWSLDHIFIDQNAIPTLVEVKRSTDIRIRREVVGQMLDYAANAVLYWPVNDMRRRFEETCRERNQEPDAVVAEFIRKTDADDSQSAIKRFWETVETNLRAGKLRLIFAADQIPTELRRVVEFLNEQMNPAEVFAIEIRQYVGSGIRTLVPSVIGSSKRATTTESGRTSVQWDRGSFISGLLQRAGSEAVAIAEQILEWASKNGATVWWGQGRLDGSCSIGITHGDVTFAVFSIWTSASIQFQFQTLQRYVSVEVIEHLASELTKIPGIHLPSEALKRYPTIKMSLLKEPERLAQYLNSLESFMEQIRTIVIADPAALIQN